MPGVDEAAAFPLALWVLRCRVCSAKRVFRGVPSGWLGVVAGTKRKRTSESRDSDESSEAREGVARGQLASLQHS